MKLNAKKNHESYGARWRYCELALAAAAAAAVAALSRWALFPMQFPMQILPLTLSLFFVRREPTNVCEQRRECCTFSCNARRRPVSVAE